MKKFRWAVAACLAVTLCAPVSALADKGSKVEKQTVRVSYNDLNIHSPEGAKLLYARLKRASETVCGMETYLRMGSLRRVMKSKQCHRETLDRTVERLNIEALERLHNS